MVFPPDTGGRLAPFDAVHVDRAIGTGFSCCRAGGALPRRRWGCGTDYLLALLFTLGAFVVRGAGCVWNDILDRDYDAKVARTALRPIASGENQRLFPRHFGGGTSRVPTILLQFNNFTILIAIASLGLVTLYPMMKL